MRILLVSYGDIEYDGRLRSLIDVFSQMGELVSFSRGKSPINETSDVCNLPYYRFIGKVIRFAKEKGPFDWLVLDNRKATIPGMIIRKKVRPSIVIQDCRELYLIREVKHFTSKIGCLFEKRMAQKADVVVCANQERAVIMQREYNLIRTPLTYENLRMLKYESVDSEAKARLKIDPLLFDNEVRIVSTSGCSIERTNDVLVSNLSKVKGPCRLYLVGDSSEKEKLRIQEILKDEKQLKVEIVGRLNQAELKYLLSKSHIGIVNYGQYDTNNKLCASGKLYEFLFEGLPVVTTTNPPLKRICEESEVGIADDLYFNGLNEVINKYDYYKTKVQMFI
ncbi:MAG: glycosyltransferase, partial [Spirochaetales bacterium]|nr:glycosyltransferase [Spirochaetales bacterium]